MMDYCINRNSGIGVVFSQFRAKFSLKLTLFRKYDERLGIFPTGAQWSEGVTKPPWSSEQIHTSLNGEKDTCR